jgi:phosphoribosylamine--glycine ligase
VRVLVVGGGGREHALCWALAPSATVFCAPGNPGTADIATNLPASPDDHHAILEAVNEHAIDLTVVGPEAPLAAGLVDHLSAAGRAAFGPSAAAARLEASKAFAKQVMEAAGVPTAVGRTFTDEAPALSYIGAHAEPLVVKASGLAAGKGAIICATRTEAKDVARRMLRGGFGDAGREIVVEEFLDGEEVSLIGITDGERIAMLPPAQDHKRIGEGDTGPNTGGMGAYSPVTIATDALVDLMLRDVFQPVLAQLDSMGARYRGFLYAGIMLTDSENPYVLEFNCRLGDPEAQVVLPLIGTGFAEHLWNIATGARWHPPASLAAAHGAAVTTVLASAGYPAAARKGDPITLPNRLPDQTILFHAGTARDPAGRLVTAGGRVLSATGLGPDVPAAAARSRALAEAIAFPGMVYRRDIAWREVARAGAS